MIEFVKADACGNDFLILEESATEKRHQALALALCARHTNIGADGIEFLDRRDGNLFLRLFNSDGSEAELSGNGTRCVAAWLAWSEGRQSVSFMTHAGVRTCEVLSSNESVFEIKSGMGVPRVLPRKIDLPGIGVVEGAMVNVGNPHFVVPVQTTEFSLHGWPWQALGKLISTSPLFPHGTNVEFLLRSSVVAAEIRIYERGCGPTTSSGTGTCASAAAAMALYGAQGELTVVAEGGDQRVSWPSMTEQMMLTGPAKIICTGQAHI